MKKLIPTYRNFTLYNVDKDEHPKAAIDFLLENADITPIGQHYLHCIAKLLDLGFTSDNILTIINFYMIAFNRSNNMRLDGVFHDQPVSFQLQTVPNQYHTVTIQDTHSNTILQQAHISPTEYLVK